MIAEAKPTTMRYPSHKKLNMEPGELYGAPSEKLFDIDGEGDFLPTPDLQDIAQVLIDRCTEFEHLLGQKIIYLWRREGGEQQGLATMGKCQKTSGLIKHFAESEWVIWLAADHVNSYSLMRGQVEALLHHELCHAGEMIDKEGNKKAKVIGHDFDGFIANVRRYGAWNENLKLCRNAWEQLSLFDYRDGDVDKETGEIRG